ncbi:amidohydrolase family protein [Heyndrickxia coagulans]|uniref:metal-dependent hydrolase family protein n=1 Tax=Heyndrickxia coagulans TaxID=1398 RepID=UPI002EB65F83|nr:amidohydrolase family protein [Heyndrickxia coagulans]
MTDRTLFYNFNLFDGTEKGLEKDAWFITENGKITDRGTNEVASSFEGEKVNLANKYVMPGLINCHIHMSMDPEDMSGSQHSIVYTTKKTIDNLHELLRAGVTYVRDLGCADDVDIELKKLLDSGELTGPGAVVSSTPLVMTGGHVYQLGKEVDGSDEVRKGARELLKKGVGCVKFMATGGVMTPGEKPADVQLSEEELRAGIEETHKKGRITAAHAQGTEGIKNALRAGIDSVEHGIYLDEEAIELFLKNDAYLVPTLAAPYFIVKEGVEHGIPQFMVDKSKEMIEAHMKSFNLAVKAGVKVAMGTDAGTPFNAFKDTPVELELMVEAGMTAEQALVASTKNASELLQISNEYGTLEVGKYADFLVLENNPLEDVKVLQGDKDVYKKGRKF